MMSKEVLPPVGDGLKRRRRRRRPGTKRRALKTEVAAVAADVAGGTSKGRVPFKCAVHMFLLRYRTALRKVPAHLPPKIHAGPPSKRVKRVSWRDEECPGSGGGGDPAVLAMGPARKPLTYTRDELLQLRDSPLCKQALDAALRGSEALALVLKKRSDSPDNEDRGARGDAPNENHKGVYGRERDRERRSADPRERVRKESESQGSGIVLSPQRRSFTSGCGAPPPATRDSPPHHTQKPDPGPVRRIGSGRIMVRDVTAAPWEREEPEPAQPRESDRYRPPAQQPDRHPQRNIHDNRYERRSYGRDSYSSDMKRERDDRFNNEKGQHREDNRRQGSGRFTQRRFEKEDEPEWFSGGPTSQLETIELRGFDEPIKRNGTTNNNKEEKWNNNNNKDGGSRSPPPRRSTSSPPVSSANSDEMADCSNDKDSGVESKAGEEQATNNDNADFNLDDFLKFDTIPDVLTNGGGEAEGSRFSRWFRRDSPTQHDNRHYERLLHNMVDDLDAGSRAPPPPNTAIEQHVFAPISPALGASARPPSLLELLRRANVDERANELNNTSSVGGKIHSLEELEARLRPTQPPPQRSDHDQAAFKRLLAQVSGGHAVPAAEQRPPPPPPPQPQPMSLLQMLNKSMEQQQKVQQQQHQQHQQHQQQQQPHIPQELVYKLLQVQQRQAQQPEITPPMHPNITEREMLQRPEALAIIQGLKAGEITVQNLMQQLGNPGMQSRHRELLITILRLHQQYRQQIGASPLPGVGPPANHLIVPPHHQPLRLSPVPHSGVPARIPSPRELQVHTQQIMHGALIKKKLEEQRENFRKRELQPKQQTAISFTPTSVLRKMTAEKESEAPSPKQQQWAPHKMPQGRPIVKGSQSGAAPPISMFAPSPADYQQHQHYLNQQQQMANAIRPFPHQQQRQLQPSQVSSLARGGTTLQQLLMQSHQRSLNEMGGEVMSGGGDNQLARWFSPELLARASAGKLPSLRVPNALSLEDLERNHHSPAVRN